MRADARENYDRLVSVAAGAFARDGGDATLKAIAREAGVGIGTLYRHFPTRESLVDAVYRAETQRLCDAATDLLGERAPLDALREWALRFLDYMATKEGMAEVLHTVLSGDEGLRLETRARITEALRLLIAAGQGAGRLRAGLDAGDVSLALGGFALILRGRPDAREAGGRLFDLLARGLAAG
ncbi:TetR/AcrR family transcriptional regulator [Dactylosporangium sp. CA-092794]|uniref:TetR/AcrR family transcriptional regulator n=1 Tax=Dactylosporangium sp. CA-092794 TaxID=3239929 RepID=UPI003D93E49E